MLRSQVNFLCFMHSVTDHSTTRWTKSGPKTRLARQARGAILEEADSLFMVPDRGRPRYRSRSGRGSQADTLVWDRQEYVGGEGGIFWAESFLPLFVSYIKEPCLSLLLIKIFGTAPFPEKKGKRNYGEGR